MRSVPHFPTTIIITFQQKHKHHRKGMRSLKSTTSTSASALPEPDHHSTAPTTSAAAIGVVHRSPWHSPVPYLFGGLAAMLGLMALALLVILCSYWSKSLSGNEDNEDEMETKKKQEKKIVYEEQFVVIMAGDHKPSCLATPTMTTSNTPADSLNIIISDHESSTRTASKASEKEQQSSEEGEEHEPTSTNISVDQQLLT